MQQLTKQHITSLLKPREADSHKGTYGHALLIAGNTFKMGAAVIAARACLRSGVGLLTVNIPKEERFILQTAIPEAMLSAREDNITVNEFSSVGIGPGIGTTKNEKDLLQQIITTCNKPLLLDADALNIIAENKSLLKKLESNTILTPHPKEFDRMFGEHSTTEARTETAIKNAKEYNIVIVLKGHKTLVAYNDEAYENTTGNAGLAKGGSGDALTGIITAFLAQGYEPFIAAQTGVYLHGLAADLALHIQSKESLLISDVIQFLGEAFKQTLPLTSRSIGFKL